LKNLMNNLEYKLKHDYIVSTRTETVFQDI
jgi:hypothetical protein